MKKLIFFSLFIFCFQNISSMEDETSNLDDLFVSILDNVQIQDEVQAQDVSKESEFGSDSESIYEDKEGYCEELPFPGSVCDNFGYDEIVTGCEVQEIKDEIKLPEITPVPRIVEQPEKQVCLNLDIEPIDSLFDQTEKREVDFTPKITIKLKIPRKRAERSSPDDQVLDNKRIRESESDDSGSELESDSDSESVYSEISDIQSDEESFDDENETLDDVAKCNEREIENIGVSIREGYKKDLRYLRCGFPGCGKIYTKLSSVKDHIRARHTNDKSYECSVCHKKFARKNVLTMHMQIHLKKKNHKCKICGHRFIKKSVLVEHMVTHTGRKDFVCKICGRSYTTRGSLSRHRRINH
ncbi:C2H2-type zinc finger protein [Candidatus Babeliales bacterium]|nr:C2H2-type zinc finger protein [Candidatus Babeliales bacterium]MCF7899615.1 C2H2-type zinc finger protein [Candidatus Babeliales bacterium]